MMYMGLFQSLTLKGLDVVSKTLYIWDRSWLLLTLLDFTLILCDDPVRSQSQSC